MSDPSAGNNLNFRLIVLERRVDRIEEGKPDVIAERVATLASDSRELRREVKSDVREMEQKIETIGDKVDGQRRVLMGLLATIASSAVLIIIAQVLLQR